MTSLKNSITNMKNVVKKNVELNQINLKKYC